MYNFKDKNVAIYIRVSTDEQALHGYSLGAQSETLTKYANEHGMNIVDTYLDDGYSARKKYTTRKNFMRMLSDVENGLIDVIIFIKLDRWFRSVSDYYKVQDILDKHNVVWAAVMEQYETATANGRFHINIRLSTAQDESDRTSERIKYVFKNKIERGEVVSGHHPVGFKIENKKLVINDDTVHIALAMFAHFEKTGSKRDTVRHLRDEVGINFCYDTVIRNLKNTLYKGSYKGFDGYCPAIIEPDRFDRIQALTKKNVKRTPSGSVYIFSGLLTCSECSHKLTSFPAKVASGRLSYYRCVHNINRKLCSSNSCLSEINIEKYILNNIFDQLLLSGYNFKFNVGSPASISNEAAITKLQNKLGKLKDLYVNNFIDIEEYKKDFTKYNDEIVKLKALESAPKINRSLKIFNDANWKEKYLELSKEGKRRFWRGVLSNIKVHNVNEMELEFL